MYLEVYLNLKTQNEVNLAAHGQCCRIFGYQVECKRAEPRDAKMMMAGGMAGLALASGLMPVNGAGGLGIPGLSLAGNPGLSYQGFPSQSVPGKLFWQHF